VAGQPGPPDAEIERLVVLGREVFNRACSGLDPEHHRPVLRDRPGPRRGHAEHRDRAGGAPDQRHFAIKEGRVYVERINITGNTKSREGAPPRAAVAEGELFTQQKGAAASGSSIWGT
jgi:hypothetical protein